MAPKAKVIVMPEGQFVGALERAVETLSADVEQTLKTSEQARDPRDVADEAIAELGRQRQVDGLEGSWHVESARDRSAA